MGLVPCTKCRRHIRAEAKCPFCGSSALVGLATATLASLALGGCGPAAKPTATPQPVPTVDAGVAATNDAGQTVLPPDDDERGRVQPLYGIDRN